MTDSLSKQMIMELEELESLAQKELSYSDLGTKFRERKGKRDCEFDLKTPMEWSRQSKSKNSDLIMLWRFLIGTDLTPSAVTVCFRNLSSLKELFTLDLIRLYKFESCDATICCEIQNFINTLRFNPEIVNEKNIKQLIAESDLSVRAKNVLTRNVSSTKELFNLNESEIFAFKNCGKIATQEIIEFINEIKPEIKKERTFTVWELARREGLSLPACNILDRNVSSVDDLFHLDKKTINNIKSHGKVFLEIQHFLSKIRSSPDYFKLGKIDEVETYQTTPQRLLSSPPDTWAIDLLPIISSKSIEEVSVADLHPDYRASTPLEEIPLSVRTSTVLNNLGLRTLGEVMLIPASQLLKQRNFGRKSLNELQDIVPRIIMNEEIAMLPGLDDASPIDFSSFESMVDSFVKLGVKGSRNQKIVFASLCFDSDRAPTLEQLGVQFDLTRERVRQILKKSMTQMLFPGILKLLDSFWEKIESLIKSGGGIVDLPELSVCIQQEYQWKNSPSPGALEHILSLNNFETFINIDQGVLQVECECLSCSIPMDQIIKLDFEENETYHIDVVTKRILDACKGRCHYQAANRFFRAHTRKLIGESNIAFVIEGDIVYQYSNWTLRKSKNLKDIICCTLAQRGSPMHFTEIGESIRSVNKHYSDSTDQNFHGALGRYEEFEIVGRGTFGLAEWGLGGYRSVSAGVEDYLTKTGLPVRQCEIIQALYPEFSPSNIYAALNNTSRFKSLGESYFDTISNWGKVTSSWLIEKTPEPLQDFLNYLFSNNNTSYKLVMAMIFIRSMDEDGSIYLNRLKTMFFNYYNSRYKKGLTVESQSSTMSQIGVLSPAKILNRSCREPIKSFLDSGYFVENESKLQISKSISAILKDKGIKELAMIAILKEIDLYFCSLPVASIDVPNERGLATSNMEESTANRDGEMRGSAPVAANSLSPMTIKTKRKVKIKL